MNSIDDRDPLDVLAEEFAARLRKGEHPSVSDYVAEHPHHAEQLRELLPAVAQMERLKRFRRSTESDNPTEMPDRFGDFRIIREVGRGGMGVVFEAVQESLGRPVALKVLSAHSHLDKKRRERFVREAHAAARLHHSNIVPVFGVGEQNGLPYYVMQLIRGIGLHDLARRWRRERGPVYDPAASTSAAHLTDRIGLKTNRSPAPAEPEHDPRYGDWTFVAEVGLQTADALHYAHLQGVLHRDVKPANLLLDPLGRVWVTDFGLAKLVEQEGLTASGDILGTLQYLPPECLTGSADSRSDVYGLGATLYELLTLEPPYPTETPARLLKLVADTEPVPLRQVNPEIPRDLETIVLKAMARDPGRRYTSAREMARDLEAFLDDRPIKARRQSMLSRGWRWCRRNPTIAVLSANMMAALVLAGVVGWVGYVKTRRALEAEAKQLTEARNSRSEAILASEKLETNLRMSLEAFEKIFDASGDRQGFIGRGFGFGPGGPGGPGGFGSGGFGPGGPGGPGGLSVGAGLIPGFPASSSNRPIGPPGEEERAAVLEAILEFYDRFAEQNATNPRLQLDAGRAYRRIGEVQTQRGNGDRASASFRRAAKLLQDLADAYPSDPAVRAELVLALLAASPDAFVHYEKRLLEARDAAWELGEQVRPFLAGSIALKIAWVRDRAGDRTGAEQAYREAIEELGPVANSRDERPPIVSIERALARSLYAMLLTKSDQTRAARVQLEDSIAEIQRLTERQRPGGRIPGELVVQTYQQLAELCERMGDTRAAQSARSEAARVFNQGGQGGSGGPGDRPKGPNSPRKN